MEQISQKYRSMGVALFIVGAAIGFFLSVGAVWANLEASFYGFNKLTNERLDSLRCPPYMTINETATISVRLTNTTDRTINQLVRAQFSTPALIISTDTARSMPPGATEVFSWQVDRNNVDLERFVFASVYRFSNYPMPAQQSICGIFVLPLPWLTGLQFVIITGLLSIAGLVVGWRLWEQGNKPVRDHALEASRAMQFMLGLVPLTMLVSLMGIWILGLMLLVVYLLMSVVTLRFFIRA